jgi:formylmethanofuran dehydrogenase subunit C
LSALINKSDESNFEFYLGGVSGQLNGLGQSNEKKLIFHGDVRSNLGVEMKKGKITLFGNAGKNVGIRLKNGEIEVFGDAGERVGYDADGGTIRVHGNIESLGWFDLKEGPMVMLGKENIFQYDRQLIKDGNQIAMPINK